MRFTPLTEEELRVQSLMQEGCYSYQVIKAEDAISQAGNEYIKLTIKVWADDGKEHLIFTNLALVKLLKHFCDINGMSEDYKSGNIPAEKCLYKAGGKVLIGIEGEKPNPKGGVYAAKNIVKDYVTAPQGSMSAPAAMKPLPAIKDDLDGDIPF
jgi:hypothetical protein